MSFEPLTSAGGFPTIHDLSRAITCGKNKEAVELAQKLLQSGSDLEAVMEEGLTKALESLDAKCNNEQFSLLEILLAGRAMMDVMEQVVCKRFAEKFPWQQGTSKIILGTIKGDVHDLGKNIVSLMLKVAGYGVTDLGKDVEPWRFVQAAVEEGAPYIGVSSLLTTTVPYVGEIRELLQAAGLQGVRVIAGGAALQQAQPAELNVDYVARNVFDMLRYLQQLKEGVGTA